MASRTEAELRALEAAALAYRQLSALLVAQGCPRGPGQPLDPVAVADWLADLKAAAAAPPPPASLPPKKREKAS